MAVTLYAGALTPQGAFDDPTCMAAEIEKGVVQVAGPFPPGDPTYYRKLFIAIAKGVIEHLRLRQQAINVTVGFAYDAPGGLSVTGIEPSRGRPSGGEPVTIRGAGFVSGATVTIGGQTATNVHVADATTITAVTPAHASGFVNVVVTNPGGQSASLDHRGFPTIAVQA
jgi:hypothetical protein